MDKDINTMGRDVALVFGVALAALAGAEAQEAAAAKEKAASTANPFGSPAGGEEIDYEKAAAALDLPKDFSKYLK